MIKLRVLTAPKDKYILTKSVHARNSNKFIINLYDKNNIEYITQM